MSFFSKILAKFKHEQEQEQRIAYLETELQQTKNDLQEIQSLLGLMNAEIEEVALQAKASKNAVRNVQRRLKAMVDKRLKQRQAE